MRTSILCAAVLGLFAAGCAGDLSGTGGGDDQQTPENCGNGTVDTGEACDDGNAANGDGCSSTCTTEQSTTPKLNVTVDKMTVNSELAKTEKIVLNLQSQGGFAESVTVAASLVNAAGQPITTMTVTGPTSVAVAADVTTPTEYSVVIPTSATGTALAATLKLDVTSTLGVVNMTSTINVAPILTLTIAAATAGDITKHPLSPAGMKAFTVLRGTKIRMVNSDTAEHISHGGGGIPHETINPGVTGQPGATYEVDTTPIAPGSGRSFGCHSHSGPNNETYATNITIQ